MSANGEEERSLIHMVTAPYRSHADEEMTLIGLVYGLVLLLVMLPLLPFLVIIWVLVAIRNAAAGASEA